MHPTVKNIGDGRYQIVDGYTGDVLYDSVTSFAADFDETEHPRNPDGTFRTKAQIIAEEAVKNNENIGVVAKRMGMTIRELSAIRGDVADHVERLKKTPAEKPSPSRLQAMAKQALRNPVSLDDDIPQSAIIPAEIAADVVRNIRAGDARSKNEGRASPEPNIPDLASVMLPVSLFSPDYIQFIRETTSPDRVKRYVDEKPDAPVFAEIGKRKGNLFLNDGGHRLAAALERGDTHIHALVPVENIPTLKQRQPFAGNDDYIVEKNPRVEQWIFKHRSSGKEIGEIQLKRRGLGDDADYVTANVLVWPEFQRQGFASEMYKNAADYVESQGRKFYLSQSRSKDAQALHRKFKKLGILTDDGEILPSSRRPPEREKRK